jgi:GT2 family glycosyltransferase
MAHCILIPTINQKQLLLNALDWYLANTSTDIYVLDNGKQGLASGTPRLKIFELEKPLGVAASWNWLIKKAIKKGHDNFLVLNDDIVLKKYPEEIDAIIEGYKGVFLRPRPAFNWSVFILSKYIFETVGEFDESFERCFYEDNDYEYRMKLLGFPIIFRDELSPDVYNNSESTKANPLLGDFLGNREYYIQKWGGLPTEEKYDTPFNQ